MTADQIGGIVRALGAAASGYAMSKGLDGGAVNSIVGALGTLAIAGWSLYTNRPGKVRS